jgi:hypothetical protein
MAQHHYLPYFFNLAMLASDWKKAMPVPASASFLHYKIIPTQVYKIKMKHTCQNGKMSLCNAEETISS